MDLAHLAAERDLGKACSGVAPRDEGHVTLASETPAYRLFCA